MSQKSSWNLEIKLHFYKSIIYDYFYTKRKFAKWRSNCFNYERFDCLNDKHFPFIRNLIYQSLVDSWDTLYLSNVSLMFICIYLYIGLVGRVFTYDLGDQNSIPVRALPNGT